jgi:hypothetical protein
VEEEVEVKVVVVEMVVEEVVVVVEEVRGGTAQALSCTLDQVAPELRVV